MSKSYSKIADRLKKLIDKYGPEFLVNAPYTVYDDLMESGEADKKTAGAVSYFLVCNIRNGQWKDMDRDEMSLEIEKECSFNSEMAGMLSDIFTLLYSEDNRKDWRKKEYKGLTDFLKDEMDFTWESDAEWTDGNVSVYCSYEADIKVRPLESVADGEDMRNLLDKNPYVKKEKLQKFFITKITNYLDKDFRHYCTCEDYEAPWAQDYPAEENLRYWCRNNGFELLDFDGSGETSDYM